MAIVLKPPAPLPPKFDKPSVFLAGSIEMGMAEDWQTVLTRMLEELNIIILNPRRDEWDASWEQRMHDTRFRGQVEWELDAQERAQVIAFYFAPTTKAPVTLLELGLAARTGRAVVCCPDGFWRQGNVEIVCRREGIPLASTLPELAAWINRRIM